MLRVGALSGTQLWELKSTIRTLELVLLVEGTFAPTLGATAPYHFIGVVIV